MGRKIVKRKTTTTTVKTIEVDGKTYIEYNTGHTMQDYQNAVINCALNENDFHPTATANSLGLGKSTVYRMLSSLENMKENDEKKRKKK